MSVTSNRQVQVVRPGALTTVQDLGRPGQAHLAVPRSGALDAGAARLANRLVGNPEHAALLETTFDGTAVRVTAACAVAVTGARAPVTVNGRSAGWGVPVLVAAGQLLDVGTATAGIRSYLAFSGGLDATQELGSCSTDLLSGLGPPPLRADNILPLGQPGRPATVDFAPYPEPGCCQDLTIHLGPRHEWLSPRGLAALTGGTYHVQSSSNRVALRLRGPAVELARTEELPSEGVVLGSVEVPPDGQPLIFLADHPTTAGYPVVGVIPQSDIDRCGQARPGTTVTFRLPLGPIEMSAERRPAKA